MTLTVGSLFSGIGGIDLGLERAGMSVRWQVELDPWCQRVLAKHWPDVERFADVRQVGAHNLAPVDVICGGFPCQDLSYAGKGAGITGARSGLWTEYARIIGELRPRYVFVENVPALLHRGLDVVLGDLAALGYDAEWDCVPASAVGAPHRRDRVWIVAYPARDGSGRTWERVVDGRQDRREWEKPFRGAGEGPGPVADPEILAERAGLRASESGGQRRRRPGNRGGAPDATDSRSERGLVPTERGFAAVEVSGGDGEPRGARSGEFWAAEPNVGRVAHGIPQRVDRLRGLGNAVVPQIPEEIGRRIIEWEMSA